MLKLLSRWLWPEFSDDDLAEAKLLFRLCRPDVDIILYKSRGNQTPPEITMQLYTSESACLYAVPCDAELAWRVMFHYCLPANGKAVLYAMRTGQAIPVTDLELAARLAAYQQRLSRDCVANVP